MNKIYFLLLPTIFFSIVSNGEMIQLKNGDTLNVVVKKQTKDALIVKHTSLGELTVKKANINNLQALNIQTIENLDDKQIAEKEPVDTGLFGTGLLEYWDRSLHFGFNGESRSSDDISFRTGFSGLYEDTEDRWDFKSIYIYKHHKHETTDNQFKADLIKDWFVNNSPWFYFAHAGFDWDKFKNWDYRGRLSAGPGYQWVKNERLELATRIGLNGVYKIIDPKNDLDLEGLIGLHLLWNISDKQSLKIDNFLYPSITDRGEYRNVTILEWTHKLDSFKDLAIKLGFHNEFDTTQTDKNDLKYHVSIGLGL